MRVTLQQSFLHGRFHATRWRLNPFDGAFLEWPPSPWRLVRAITSRWYQWVRECPRAIEDTDLNALISALCTSSYSFHLAPQARPGIAIRQYHPVEFGWQPAGKGKSAARQYGASLIQDNYVAVPRDGEIAVWWIIEGEQWSSPLLAVLDRCVERITYFGRAESLSVVRRAETDIKPNSSLFEKRSEDLHPVLCPDPQATREDVERWTDDPSGRDREIPPGTRQMYASVPEVRPLHDAASRARSEHRTNFVQFAILWDVVPESNATSRLTAHYKAEVVRELLLAHSKGTVRSWRQADSRLRAKVELMIGKDSSGLPLEGHRHTEFFVWWNDRRPTRLLVRRGEAAFDQTEIMAMYRAACKSFSWSATPSIWDWQVKLIPLDLSTKPPASFDQRLELMWESVTPYVPTRHHIRRGLVRERESIPNQIRRELLRRGINSDVTITGMGSPEWVAVPNTGSAHRRQFLGNRRGYRLRLAFSEPIMGPLRLGSASSLGLGLFRPILR